MYQDYIIKDGKFIGKFEEMYQRYDDPWKQIEGLKFSYSRMETLVSLRRWNIKSILEIGCGLGAFTNYIKSNCDEIDITGVDLSKTAIKKAKLKYPHLNFIQEDITNLEQILNNEKSYDAILLSEILWYILPNLKEIFIKIEQYMSEKLLLVNQVFYKGQQKYGIEYFTNINEMINYFPFEVLCCCTADCIDNNSIESHTIFKI